MSMDIKRMENFKIGKLDEFASQIKDIISEQRSKTTVDAIMNVHEKRKKEMLILFRPAAMEKRFRKLLLIFQMIIN